MDSFRYAMSSDANDYTRLVATCFARTRKWVGDRPLVGSDRAVQQGGADIFAVDVSRKAGVQIDWGRLLSTSMILKAITPCRAGSLDRARCWRGEVCGEDHRRRARVAFEQSAPRKARLLGI